MSKSILSPSEKAWAFLKQEMMPEEPEHGYDLTQVMEPQDVKAALNFSQNMSPEMQQTALAFDHAFKQMSPQEKDMMIASMHRVLNQFRGNLGQVLPSYSEGAPGPVRKLVPLVIGAVFAVDAVLQSQGQKQSLVGNAFATVGNLMAPDKPVLDENGMPMYDEEGNVMMEPAFGEVNWGDSFEFEDEANLVNPFTGIPIDTIEDPAWYESLGYGLASGAMSFVNPFFAVGGIGRGATRLAGKSGAYSRIGAGKALANNPAARYGTRRAQGKAGKKALKDMTDDDYLLNYGAAGPVAAATRGAKGRMATRGQAMQSRGAERLADIQAQHVKATAKTGGAGVIGAKGARGGGKVGRMAGASGSRAGKLANLAYRGYQANMRAPSPYGIDDAMAAFGIFPGALGASEIGDIGSIDNPASYSGSSGPAAGGQASGMGDAYGMGNVTNVDSNLGARREIWNPHADYASSRGQMLAGRGHDAGAFRGLGTVRTGEDMRIGERMLKEAQEKMYKEDDCPGCGEAVGKMGCMKMGCGGMNKADKKPAHGMVIVIGSKAGPGPSKDGKREKLDSEKDKKEE